MWLLLIALSGLLVPCDLFLYWLFVELEGIQPALGRSDDVWSYSTSYVLSPEIQTVALPFLALARRENAAPGPTPD